MDQIKQDAGAELRQEIENAATEDRIAEAAAQRVAAALAVTAATVASRERQESGDVADPARQLFSLGWLCQRFQLEAFGIRHAMRQANITFAECRNEVPYVDGYGLVAIADYLRSKRRGEK